LSPKTQGDLRIAGLILAAGLGQRFGSAATKAVAPFDGVPMVRRVAEAGIAAGLSPLIVVTGRAHSEVEAALGELELRFVHNASPERGQGSSLALGAKACPADLDGLAVLLADQPLVSATLIRSVIRNWATQPAPRGIVRPVAPSRAAHPVLFDARFIAELRELRQGQSGRDVILRHREALLEVPVDDPLQLVDVDTLEALSELETAARELRDPSSSAVR
jgi:molybdenum cofactor cytidylyltransferase